MTPSNDVMTSVLGICIIQRVLISVLLFILPRWRCCIIILAQLVVHLLHTLTLISTNILPQSLLNNAISSELFIRLDQHLSYSSTCPYKLEKGIIF